LKRTVLYDCHIESGGRLVDFAGWQMPVQYPGGILREHLETRRSAGLFDVSHMGRFEIRGPGAMEFLRGVLTNDAAKLPTGQAQYTLLANENGGAIDDAFLYRFWEDRWLLVVNASNAPKDWDHLVLQAKATGSVQLKDVSGQMAMIALQGPRSEGILEGILNDGRLPEGKRNSLGWAVIAGTEALVGRTGYTGEPVCFELFVQAVSAGKVWRILKEKGAVPVGLGARDTLRLEASLPLYGHEYGRDFDGHEIPIMACPTARFGVDLNDPERRFIGREAIERQSAGVAKRIFAVRILDKGIARAGAAVFYGGREAGRLTSGTMVPYWVTKAPTCPAHCGHGSGWEDHFSGETGQRAVGLALLDGSLGPGMEIEIDNRGRRLGAVIVKRNLDNRAGPFTFAVI
jgi:aminomethyltransferase